MVPYIPQSKERLAAELHSREHDKELSTQMGTYEDNGERLMSNTVQQWGG